jgi:hypothetical protein
MMADGVKRIFAILLLALFYDALIGFGSTVSAANELKAMG